MPTPGVLYVATSLTHSDAPSEEKFNHWYNEIHIPDLLKVKGLKTAIRYKNNDPNVIPQFLTLYPLEDLALLATKEFQEVPITHDKTWGKKSKEEVAEIAGLTPRVYATIQKYEPEKKLAGPAPLILHVGLTPGEGTEDDFDAWYREEHLVDLAKCPGYTRSRRFKIIRPGSEESAPEYVAFHEFEGEQLPMTELLKTTETEWSKKNMGGATKTEMNVWGLIQAFGDKEFDF